MTSLMIDTNFYGEIMMGTERAKKNIEQTEKVLICPIVLGELLVGFKYGNRKETNTDKLHLFLQLPTVTVTNITRQSAEFYALIVIQLKKAGTPIPTNDIWIAACCLEHGATLATDDNHFQKISNLPVV